VTAPERSAFAMALTGGTAVLAFPAPVPVLAAVAAGMAAVLVLVVVYRAAGPTWALAGCFAGGVAEVACGLAFSSPVGWGGAGALAVTGWACRKPGGAR